MPLTLTLTKGVLPKGKEKVAFARLSEAMLKWHVLNKDQTIAGMQETSVAFIEWKVPSFAFTNRDAQIGYFEEATNIIHELSGGKQPKDKIFINVVHAVDGAWNMDGKARTNAELGELVSKG